MASTADGKGYWLVASDGGIFSFGDATFHGSMGGVPLNRPIVGMASTADGKGYWLVASDGGIFSLRGRHLPRFDGRRTPQPADRGHGLRPRTAGGYWLVASDGGIFAFGDATFHGSMGGVPLNRPIVGMASTADGGLLAGGLRRRRLQLRFGELPGIGRWDRPQRARRGHRRLISPGRARAVHPVQVQAGTGARS